MEFRLNHSNICNEQHHVMSLNQIRRGTRRYSLGSSGGAPLYYPTNGLVGLWRPSASSGTVLKDVSVNGFDGTLTGAAPPTFTPACVGTQMLEFWGGTGYGSGYVSFSAAASNFDNPSFSAGGWILLARNESHIATFADCNNQSNYGWVININQNGSGSTQVGWAALWLYTGSWVVGAYTNSALIPIGAWVHLFVTSVSTGATTMYINADSSGCTSVTRGAITWNSNVFTLGQDLTNGNNFYGLMSDVFLYNRALSAAEVTSLYEAGLP
jgi:hypothetical protein